MAHAMLLSMSLNLLLSSRFLIVRVPIPFPLRYCCSTITGQPLDISAFGDQSYRRSCSPESCNDDLALEWIVYHSTRALLFVFASRDLRLTSASCLA